MASLQIGNLECTYHADRFDRNIYFLSCEPIDPDDVEKLARAYRCNLAVITGMDQYNDLSPREFSAGNVVYGGGADNFATRLIDEVIPTIESDPAFGDTTTRDIVGTRLSGLFATYVWLTRPYFDSMASISGSFGVDGFVNFVKHIEPSHQTGVAYFSLGVNETSDNLSIDTAEVVDAVRRNHLRAIMEWNRGDDSFPVFPRLEKAVMALTTQHDLGSDS